MSMKIDNQLVLAKHQWIRKKLIGRLFFCVIITIATISIWPMIAAAGYDIASFNVEIEDGGVGGFIVYDVDSDGDIDIIITEPGRIVAYDQSGTKMWRVNDNIHLPDPSSVEREGQPGHEGPGIFAGDVDNDNVVEVLYVDLDNHLVSINGQTGNVEKTISLPSVISYDNAWSIAIIANFRGQGDTDILLGTEINIRSSKPYLRTKKIAAYAYSELAAKGESAKALWTFDDYICPSHSQPRVADLDFDGHDEVVGGNIISHTGVELFRTDIGNSAFPHIDSISIADIDPNLPGLECVAARELPYSNTHVYLYNKNGLIWKLQRVGTGGDKIQVGDYDPSIQGLEIWTRGEESEDMQVWDKDGNVLANYDFSSTVNPSSWSDNGLESYHRCRWTGDDKEYMLVRERHKENPDVGIIDPLTASFLTIFGTDTKHCLAADITGDWREEVISLRRGEIVIYTNTDSNPNPEHPSLWSDSYYNKSHQNHNYYIGAGGGDFPQNQSKEPVAHWRLDDGSGTIALDSSGKNDGTLENGADAGWTANGKVKGALDFDGTDDLIDIDNPASLQITGAMSLAAWVKIDSFASNGRIVDKQGNRNHRGWSLNIESLGDKGAFQIAEGPSSCKIVNTNRSLPAGEWVHLVGVYEPGVSLKIYVNGSLDNTVTSGVPGSQYNSPINVMIGARPDSLCHFDGMIDDVRIYNRVLSDSEIYDIVQKTGPDDQFLEKNGVACMEAENYMALEAGSGNAANSTWSEFDGDSAEVSNGIFLEATPNDNINTLEGDNGPRLDYNVKFQTAGTYRIWVRMSGSTGTDDSVRLGVDGTILTSGGYGVMQEGSWRWRDRSNTGVISEFTVTSGQIRTINVWMREDGTRVDKVVVQLANLAAPTGLGPDQSPLN